MKQIKKWLFPEKSKWIDISCFEVSGYYKLIQMRYVLHNNKKEFRVVNIGFVNDYTQKLKIYEIVINNN